MNETLPFVRLFNGVSSQKRNFWPEGLFIGILVLSALVWPQGLHTLRELMMFGLWALVLAMLFSLTLTNFRTMLLPDASLKPLGLTVLLYLVVGSMDAGSLSMLYSGLVGGFLTGGALYLTAAISSGRLIGGGDIKLGFIAGLLLGLKLGLICVVLFGLLASLAMLTAYTAGKTTRLRIPSQMPSGVMWTVSIIFCILFGQVVVG